MEIEVLMRGWTEGFRSVSEDSYRLRPGAALSGASDRVILHKYRWVEQQKLIILFDISCVDYMALNWLLFY